MADEPSNDLTGAAHDLAVAGYKPMPDRRADEEEPIGSDNASLREAAEKISEQSEDVVVRQYRDAEGKPAAANEAVTLRRASRDYAAAVAAEKLIADGEDAERLAERVDALRMEALASDPEAAEFYGFDLPETDAAEAGRSNGDVRTQDADTGANFNEGLDPALARALEHPQVRQAIDEEIAETHKVRQGYLDALTGATQIAQASFINQFPEFVGVPLENLPGVLEQMSRHEPAKFARVRSAIAATDQLLAQHQQESQRQAEAAYHSFRAHAKSEDARFDAMLKGEPVETQRAVMQEIIASAKASGLEASELTYLLNTEPLMRNATFQRMMYDAGKYRLMMKAKDAVTTRPLPPVQRPGAAASRGERENVDLRSLNARLSSTGDIKDAVALYHARRGARR
ncbi:hypothetical protein QA635_15165 [Bradyrhizobium brasilense]|uniref:hypothetical protein n=1 Tax=Bradyrhizobium brasilense TaxID=1419277 RepID=UPI0024B190EB|nr:hypothetical protein [Bradyrhizobium australafricanum]WFU35668.1 hypothetical protein QA635_15165 [Bradyrhizobium australafricanum]